MADLALQEWIRTTFADPGEEVQTFCAAGVGIHVYSNTSVASRELRALVPAEGVQPDLDVFVASGSRLPAVDYLHPLRPGLVGAIVAGRWQMTLEMDRGNLFVYDPIESKVFWLLREARPEWHFASPLRQVLHSKAVESGGALLHAGLVSDGEKDVLIVGSSFVGKSTAVAWAVSKGFLSGGDDYVAVEKRDDVWQSRGVYRVVKLRNSSPALDALRHLPSSRHGNDSQECFYLDPETGLAPGRHRPIHALVSLEKPENAPGFSPVSATRALSAMAPSTIMQSAFHQSEVMSRVAQLAADVPALAMARPTSASQLAESLSSIFHTRSDDLRDSTCQ